MKFKKVLLIICISMMLLLSACSNKSALAKLNCLREPVDISYRTNVSEYTKDDYAEFKNKMKIFSSKLSESLLKQEYKENENFACSPLSIEFALGLAVSAANNETRDEILSAFDIDFETFNEYYKAYFTNILMERKDGSEKPYSEITSTNSIWIDNDIKLKDSGLDNLQNDYYCYSYEADFNNNNKTSNKAIRQFVKEKTNNLIDQDFDISEDTFFLLMNTLYLKDIWNDMGRDLKYASEEYKFKNLNGNISNKSLLEGYYSSGKAMTTETYSAFHTYTLSNICLHFIKPNDGVNINNLFNASVIKSVATASNYITKDDDKFEAYHTKCIFPEFKAEADLNLKDTLMKDFNIKNLFDINNCDFSNLSDNKVYCNNIRHVAKLDVNKKGIEGAAITMLGLAGAAGPGKYTNVYETFVVDKEYIFVLTYGDTIIFSGVVTNID